MQARVLRPHDRAGNRGVKTDVDTCQPGLLDENRVKVRPVDMQIGCAPAHLGIIAQHRPEDRAPGDPVTQAGSFRLERMGADLGKYVEVLEHLARIR